MATDRALPGRISALTADVADLAADIRRFSAGRIEDLAAPSGWHGKARKRHTRGLDAVHSQVEAAAAALSGAAGQLVEFRVLVETRIAAEEQALRDAAAAERARQEAADSVLPSPPWLWPPRSP